MSLQRISWKFPVEALSAHFSAQVFTAFNDWIKNPNGHVFIDVADYEHASFGPVTLLVGHEFDCVLDNSDGPLCFMYRHKRGFAKDTPLEDVIQKSFTQASQLAKRFAGESVLKDKLKTNTTPQEIIINDRAFQQNEDNINILKAAIAKVTNKKCDAIKTPNDSRLKLRLD